MWVTQLYVCACQRVWKCSKCLMSCWVQCQRNHILSVCELWEETSSHRKSTNIQNTNSTEHKLTPWSNCACCNATALTVFISNYRFRNVPYPEKVQRNSKNWQVRSCHMFLLCRHVALTVMIFTAKLMTFTCTSLPTELLLQLFQLEKIKRALSVNLLSLRNKGVIFSIQPRR